MKTKLLSLVSVLMAAMILLSGCGANPSGVATDYLTALSKGEYDKAIALSTVSIDRDIQSGKTDEGTQIAKAYIQHMSFVVKGTEKVGDKYRVKVEIKGPDMEAIGSKVTATMLAGLFKDAFSVPSVNNDEVSKRLTESIVTEMGKSDVPTLTTEGTLMVEKVDKNWKVTTPILGGNGFFANGTLSLADRTRKAAEIQERIKTVRADIDDLKRQKEFAAQAGDKLRQFQVLNAQFAWNKGSFMDDPIISLTVRNNTGQPISRAYFHGRLMSVGRSTPWVDEDFNYEIRGGIEPGETQTWRLSPNSFGAWGSAPKDRNDLALEVSVKKLNGANGQTLYDAEFPQYKADRLADLEKQLKDLQAQVNTLTGSQA